MVMLSQLQRFTLRDEQGRHARLRDLSVALLDGDYPPVTRLYFLKLNKQRHSLSWEKVKAIDWPSGQIRVASLDESVGESTGSMAKER